MTQISSKTSFMNFSKKKESSIEILLKGWKVFNSFNQSTIPKEAPFIGIRLSPMLSHLTLRFVPSKKRQKLQNKGQLSNNKTYLLKPQKRC